MSLAAAYDENSSYWPIAKDAITIHQEIETNYDNLVKNYLKLGSNCVGNFPDCRRLG